MSDAGDDRRRNATSAATTSAATTSSTDGAMDTPSPDVAPGISLANGPMQAMDVDVQPATNGTGHGNGHGTGHGTANGTSAGTANGTSSGTKRKASPANGNAKRASSSEDEDDVPLKKRKTTAGSESDEDDVPLVDKLRRPIAVTAAHVGEESGDEPIAEKLQQQKKAIEQKAAKEAKAIRAKDANGGAKRKAKKEDSDSDDEPIVKKKAPAVKKKAPAKKANGAQVKHEESSDDDKPLKKKAPAKKAPVKKEPVKKEPTKKEPVKKEPIKKEPATPPKKGGKAKVKEESPEEEGDEEEEYRWWEDPQKGDGTTKWTTLEHNGVVFPPEYEPLPNNAHMLYDGTPVDMDMEAEEIAYAFGAMLNSTHNVENPTFQKNFFADFKEALDRTGHAKDRHGNKVTITEFDKCDFKPIFNHVDAERAAKKALPAAEKKKLKAEKDELEAPYMYCVWDGRKQKVGNFRVEPPGLFRGRGEHPKTGKWKKRVMPEQITINIGKEAMVPKPPEGHKWKEIKHDQEGTWLAMWQENINGAYKYVMLAANSDIKGQSDYKKFEKARELKKHIDRIRKDYEKELKSEIMAERQRATAMYLIDRFALRAGNEKGEDEADTVGCCSLKFENVSLSPPNKVIFDFLGKDSIRFYDEVEVDPQVFKNLKIFKRSPKKDGDEIFDRLTTSGLNKHLSNYMPGLTAKVFRTYNASYTMSQLLQGMKAEGTIPEKVLAYNNANRRVAILCNHKRTVAASHAQQMEKVEEKIKGLQYQQYRIKQMILATAPTMKKQRGEGYFALPEGLDREWQAKHHGDLVEEQRVKVQKKFDKDNEKLEAEGKKPMKAGELADRMEPVTELEAKLQKELTTGTVVPEGKSASVDKYDKDLEKLDTRIATLNTQAEDRENNKEVALGTSKINYIDPRLTVVFSKKFDVPIERFFSKTLREKFDWAIKSVDEHWEF